MPMPRRAANRQEILDAFSDLESSAQESLIAELSQVHRILKRERERNCVSCDPAVQGWLAAQNALPKEHEA